MCVLYDHTNTSTRRGSIGNLIPAIPYVPQEICEVEMNTVTYEYVRGGRKGTLIAVVADL